MATKRASRKSSEGMDLMVIARWALLIGLVLAVVIPFIPPTATETLSQGLFYILIVLALIAGFLHITREDEHHFILIAVGLFLFRSLLGSIPTVGSRITDILGVVSFFLGVAVLAVVVRNIVGWYRS